MMDSKPVITLMITNLKKLRSSDSSFMDPTFYHKLVGSMTYLVNTRPDICLVVNILIQSQLEPRHDHWIATKHILRYLHDGKSTTGGCFSLGSIMISWMSRNQDLVDLSRAKADYMVACEVGKEIVWLRKLLTNLFEKPLDPTMINCDNQSCIKMFRDPVFHARMKHIKNKSHYTRNLVQDGIVKLQYVPKNDQVVDILTKSLPNKKFGYLRSMLGLVNISDFFDEIKVWKRFVEA
eukprot:PITA_29711